jgi:hypothetical protein
MGTHGLSSGKPGEPIHVLLDVIEPKGRLPFPLFVRRKIFSKVGGIEPVLSRRQIGSWSSAFRMNSQAHADRSGNSRPNNSCRQQQGKRPFEPLPTGLTDDHEHGTLQCSVLSRGQSGSVFCLRHAGCGNPLADEVLIRRSGAAYRNRTDTRPWQFFFNTLRAVQEHLERVKPIRNACSLSCSHAEAGWHPC